MPGIIVAASSPSRWFGTRCDSCLHDFGTRADAAISKLDVHLHAGRNRNGRAQRPAGSIAHQRKPTRQYAAIRKRCEQLGIPFTPRPARIEKIVHGPAGTLRECANALALARDAHTARRDIRRHARPQAQCSAGIAVAAAHLLGYPPQTVLLIDVLCVGLVLGALADVMAAGLQGTERFGKMAFWSAVQQYATSALAIGLLLADKGVVVYVLVLALGPIISILANGYQLWPEIRAQQ